MSAQFIGSKISLISKSEIRYEGILYTIDPRESTIALAKVRSFGTEDRSADKPVAPRSEVYEYIIFRASDIKDLLVDDPPAASPALADPAIIQAQSVAGSASNAFPSSAFSSGGSTNLTGSGSAGQSNKQSTLSTVLGRASPIAEKSSSRRASPGVRAKSPAGSQSGEHRSGQRSDSNRAPGGYPRPSGSNANNYRNARQGQSSRLPQNSGSNNNGNYRDNRRINSQPQSDWPSRPAPIGGNRARPPRPPMLDVRKLEEFDFEKANAEFVELTKDVEDLKLTDGKEEEPQDDQKKENVETYNKAKSFFDTISCEAIERQKGTMNRVDRRQERKLNQETFGVSGVYNRNWNNRGGRGGPGQRNMQSRGYNQGGRGPRNNGNGQGGRYPRYNNYNYNYNNNYRSQQGGDRRPPVSQGESKKSNQESAAASESAGSTAQPTVWT